MTSHGNDRHGAQSGDFLHLGGKLADNGRRGGHGTELVARHAQRGHEVKVEVARHGVENLRGGSHRIFADSLACEQVAQCVGDEEHLVGLLEGTVPVAPHLIELEEGIEIHKLDARLLIDRLLRHGLLEVGFHGVDGVGVAIGQRIAQQLTVLAYADEVAAPGVDADAMDGNLAVGGQFQTLDNLMVEGIEVPIYVTRGLDEGVVEAGELFKGKLSVCQRADNRAATGGPEIYCEEVFR